MKKKNLQKALEEIWEKRRRAKIHGHLIFETCQRCRVKKLNMTKKSLIQELKDDGYEYNFDGCYWFKEMFSVRTKKGIKSKIGTPLFAVADLEILNYDSKEFKY